jgi:cell division protein FtsB
MTTATTGHTFKISVRRLYVGVVTAWLLAVAVLALIGAVYLAQAGQAAQEGATLEKRRLELAALQRANTQLEVDIALAQSPERLAQRATEMGYRPATIDEIDYLPVKQYPTPQPSPTAHPPQGAPRDPFRDWLGRLLGWTSGGP